MRSDVSECARCDWSILADSPGVLRSKTTSRANSVCSKFRIDGACSRSPHSGRLPAGKQRSPARRQETKSAPKTQPHQQPEPTVPAPPRAKVQQRSVATWTHQDRQEAPKFFVSDLPWKAQRRVRREMPLERVPWPFRGRTVTEADVRSQGARLPDPPGVQECALCGVNVYSQSHFKGSLHVAKTKAARDGRRRRAST
ncbi:hypothetical protein HPB52_022696 [Rhipicephalus sanguineus]|uniref:Uncharacterized protein n=1 Tax=Rhipicephalus sanguineus TaxID=34632 RepID=A0A9D4PRP5_RHISA|nr:hypothetical protein HPB52_022696 [Rhipicephalus sanguineus]